MASYEHLLDKNFEDQNSGFQADVKLLDEKYPDVTKKSFIDYCFITNNILPGKLTVNIYDPQGEIPEHIKTEVKRIADKHFLSSSST